MNHQVALFPLVSVIVVVNQFRARGVKDLAAKEKSSRQ